MKDKNGVEWVTLKEIRPGAVFCTLRGEMAVKSEYTYGDGVCQCVLLESGEYAHFPGRNNELVREIELSR